MRIRPAHHPGAFYHVMLRGNRKQIIFRDDHDRQRLAQLVARSLARYRGEIHAFCWMPNHLHLLVQVREAPVHRIVHYFATLYARYFNLRYELVGHLFQGRYKSRYVDSDGYFLQLLRYIHQNPVEAGMAGHVADYPWSSMRAYLGLNRVPWLTTRCAFAYFDNDRRRLLDFVQGPMQGFDPWKALDHRGYQLAPRQAPPAQGPPAWRNLDALLAAACGRFDVTLDDLQGDDVRRVLTLARCWIAVEAQSSHVASLSAVARRLNRSPAGLSRSIRRNAGRLEKVQG
jgi:REP element-mobilizing transposase RayT